MLWARVSDKRCYDMSAAAEIYEGADDGGTGNGPEDYANYSGA